MEPTSTLVLSGVVTQELLSGVFAEIVGLLPVAMPVMIGYAAIRKGIAFVKGIIYGA